MEVPETTMSQDTQALLEEGTCSDVEIVVQGEVGPSEHLGAPSFGVLIIRILL